MKKHQLSQNTDFTTHPRTAGVGQSSFDKDSLMGRLKIPFYSICSAAAGSSKSGYFLEGCSTLPGRYVGNVER
jgi:hypothetical protein